MPNGVQEGINFEDAPMAPIHRKIVYGTFMGQIGDGYSLAIIGIALSYATEPLGLTSFWIGLIAAGAMFGLLFGCLFSGPIVDRIGRRPMYVSVMAVCVIMTLSQFFINDPLTLTIVRFILGIIIGADYAIGISLLSEWMPARKRPRALAWLLVYWTFGYTFAYIVGFFMDGLGDDGWRWVLCTAAIPSILALFLRLGSPESPKWLVAKGRTAEATELIKKWLGDGYYILKEEQAASASWFALFAPQQWRNTVVSCVFFCTQVLPFFAISLFLPLVLGQLRIENPYASGVLYNVCTVIGVLVGTWLCGVIGRRPYLLWTYYIAAGLLVTLTVWQTMPSSLALVFVTLLSLTLAIAIVPDFVYPPELFPTELRSSGVGLTVAISRLGAGGGTFMLPIISEHYGIHAALWVCIGSLLFGAIITQMWAPETFIKPEKSA